MENKGYRLIRQLVQFTLLACWFIVSSPVYSQAVKSHFIAIADSKLYVEESGQGPALLLLHGGLIDHRMWEKQVNVLNKSFRVLNCDMRKHGLTQDGDSTFQNSTAIALILDSFGIARAHIMGLSLGAVAATDFVLDYPERVNKLILAAPGLIGYELSHDPVLVANNKQIDAARQRQDTLAYVDYFLRSWTDGPKRKPTAVDPKIRAFVMRMVSDNLKYHQWTTHLRFREEPLAIHRLSSINSPTLVLVGSLDMSDILAISEELARKISNVKKVIIPRSAHMLNIEQPIIFNQHIREFLLK